MADTSPLEQTDPETEESRDALAVRLLRSANPTMDGEVA
jgi:hypothetical protein